jgi:hypothetical protein
MQKKSCLIHFVTILRTVCVHAHNMYGDFSARGARQSIVLGRFSYTESLLLYTGRRFGGTYNNFRMVQLAACESLRGTYAGAGNVPLELYAMGH